MYIQCTQIHSCIYCLYGRRRGLFLKLKFSNWLAGENEEEGKKPIFSLNKR